MTPKISVLVPVYNVEKYLRQCLDSIINQTFEDIEIICINDGSLDGSLKILQEYQSQDNRIVIIDKPNSGYGDSMNTGLSKARGEYIGIVESDDFIEPEMFETLFKCANQHNLDLVRCQYYEYKTQDDSNYPVDNTWVVQNKVYCPISDDLIPFYQAPAIWCNLVSKKLLDDNNIRFLTTPGASYQDTSFAFKLYACSKRFMMIPNHLLHYRIDNANSSVNNPAKADFVLEEYAEISRFAKEKGIYEQVKTLIPRIKYACYIWNFNRLVKDLKYPFLCKIGKEFKQHLINNEIDKKLFSKKELKRIKVISYFSWIYRNRESL